MVTAEERAQARSGDVSGCEDKVDALWVDGKLGHQLGLDDCREKGEERRVGGE